MEQWFLLYLFRLWGSVLSQQGQKKHLCPQSPYILYCGLHWLLIWAPDSLKKHCQVKSKETMSLVFLRLLGIKLLTGEMWHLFIINILFFRLLFTGLLTKCPEARLSNYLNINKMLVSWLRPHLPRFHSDYWFIGDSNFLSAGRL